MRKIEYYVAMTVDGYIAGPNENISGYVNEGTGLDQVTHDFGLLILSYKVLY